MIRKFFSLGIIVSAILLLVGGYFTFNSQVEAAEKIIVHQGEVYTRTLQQAIAQDSLTNGSVAILDASGKAIENVLSLDETGKVLTVKNLPIGLYTLQIKKTAYVKATELIGDFQVTVEVIDQVKNITSMEDLKKYFETYLAKEQEAYNRLEREFEAKEESSALNSIDETLSDKGGSGDFSTTNNQVDGIEEGDISITDGKNIYTLVDNRIVIVDAKELQVVKSFSLSKNAYPTNLMLHNNTLIVSYVEYVENQREQYYDVKSLTKIAFYDTSDAKNLKLIREVGQDGDIINIRKSGNYLYVVTSRTPNYWLLPEVSDLELRPATYDNDEEKLVPFDQIRILPDSNQPSYLIVSAMDVSNVKNATWTTESFLGNSGQLYMSKNAIYIASMNNNWLMFSTSTAENELVDGITREVTLPSAKDETSIYKIKVDKTNISMAAKGKVKGSILNQFSMDEFNGYFRIATTEGNAWGTDANSKNHLFILDNDLKQVGAVNDLAKGERIYSARFMGEKAYLVTFKETDPLFVIDTSNPKAPKVLGELKIPGFSNYLHPIDENHLLGIGYDTEVRLEDGAKEPTVTTGGIKLSLFDISDFSNPKEKQAVVIGGRGTYSSVLHDHKALFRNSKNNLYGLPITIYEATDDEYRLKYEGTGAYLYEVTADGIKLASKLFENARPGEQYEDNYHVVRRILFVNDTLYNISSSKITSYNGKTFKKQKTVGF